MKKFVWVYLLIVVTPCYVIAGADDAESFIKDVVESDFLGDSTPRVRRVMLSDALKQKQYINSRDVADILPEAYTLDYDPVIVVSGYKILSKESIGVGPTCVMVQYDTLATTKGRGTPLQSRSGFRLFYPLLIPKIDIVNFCVVASNDGYVLIDPPVPRVGLASLVEFYTKKLARAEKRLAEVSVKDVYAKRNIVEMCDYYKRQLKVLNKLSQRA